MWSSTIDDKYDGTTPMDAARAKELAGTDDVAVLVEAALTSRSRAGLTAVGKNPALPEWARELMRARWRGVRQQSVLREAAKHAETPAHLLEWFAVECGLAQWVVGNPSCPVPVFGQAAQEHHMPTLKALATSPCTPDAVRTALADHEAHAVRVLFARQDA